MNPELISYIKERIDRGDDKVAIKSTLVQHGWHSEDIEGAFVQVTGQQFSIAPASSPIEVEPSPSDPIKPLEPLSTIDQEPAPAAISVKIPSILDNLGSSDQSAQSNQGDGLQDTLRQGSGQAGDSNAPRPRWVIPTIIVGVLAIAAYVVYAFVLNSPNKIIATAFSNAAEAKSVSFSGQIVFTAPNAAASSSARVPLLVFPAQAQTLETDQINLTFSGAIDNSSAKPKSSISWLIRPIESPLVTLSTTIGLDLITIGDLSYLKVNAPVQIDNYNLTGIVNRWIQVNWPAIEEALNFGGLGNVSKTQGNSQELLTLFAKHRVIDIDRKFAEEEINGEPSYHFSFKVNRRKLQSFLVELESQGNADETTANQLSKYLNDLENTGGEIWISKSDSLPTRIKIDLLAATSSTDADIGKAVLTMSFSKFNQPVTIEPPTSSTLLGKALYDFVAALVADSATSSLLANTDEDADQLPDVIELFYGTTQINADGDGDGYLDGVEVKNGYNPKGIGTLKY